MCYRSPAKVLRNAKRITKFIERKPKSLTIPVLPVVNIPPVFKSLSSSKPINTNLSPNLNPASEKDYVLLPPNPPYPVQVQSPSSLERSKPITEREFLDIMENFQKNLDWKNPFKPP